MRQKSFEQRHRREWDALEECLEGHDAFELPARHRALCRDLSLAGQRGYSPALAQRLQELALRSHRRLYGVRTERPLVLLGWMREDVPRTVRKEWRLLLMSFLAFWGTGLALGLVVAHSPHWALSWMDADQLDRMREMYGSAHERLGRRGAQDDLAMFGFYIWNNVSICFRTFAGGLFGGVTALVSLAFNGVHGGIVASWLSRDPTTSTNFWSFVVTHSSFEITGLQLSGMAGMRLGLSILLPGRLRRGDSLREAARGIFPVLVAAALLTVLAAFFEAFWSARQDVAPLAKYVVGGACWIGVVSWLALSGRRRRGA